MKCVEISKPGGPEVLVAAERPNPGTKSKRDSRQSRGRGRQRPDVLQRMGRYRRRRAPRTCRASKSPAKSSACGAAVKMWKIGDKVCALVQRWRLRGILHGARSCRRCRCRRAHGARGRLPAGNVLHGLVERVRPRAARAGETLLVQGGSSGIGVTAIQMAAAMGNRVFATAGSDEKCAACVKLGAEKAFNYRTQDFAAEVKAATGGKGVNVVLDMVAGDYVPSELKCLADDGRLVFIAMLGGRRPSSTSTRC
jgi:NADPH2:quinone reductase